MDKKIHRKPHKPHWYKLHVGSCPVCGRDASYRERQYSPKPEDLKDRIEYIPDAQSYDWCDVSWRQ